MAFTQESCDITIPTDPERLSVAPKGVAPEGLNLIFFLVEREGQRIPWSSQTWAKTDSPPSLSHLGHSQVLAGLGLVRGGDREL